jgi:hypothetical protein
MGNCYKIDYPNNKSNIYKIVNNQEDENYTLLNNCININKYRIVSTGECVSKCPNETVFHTYTYIYRNFSTQTNTAIGKMYPLTLEKAPKYLFNNVCYQVCPSLTKEDDKNNKCKCIYGWEQNNITKMITCYPYKEYCLSNEYYYHVDTKECVPNGCKENYHQFNFECYTNNNYPENYSLYLTDNKKLETNLNYCYIDKNYKTHCSNEPFNTHNLRYSDTKIYFESCDDSLNFFNIQTYLYKNICYINCPEETTKK